MDTREIGAKIEGAVGYLTEHPDEARYTDSQAVARLGEGLRCTVEGPGGASLVTDMPQGVGGRGEHPSPGWLWRAAMASCTATVVGMRAAQRGIDPGSVEVTVDSESDDRGILGMDESVPAGPLSIRVHVRIEAPGLDTEQARELAEWGSGHCPVCEGAKRAIPVTLEVETA
ncbi:MAG: OsmC family protein [Actinobacteria bacterium]|nr:OsmC family protein [Actinomycetota bacterium]